MAQSNIIVICTDQQRADSLGCMGNAAAATPNIDALAGRGVLYRRHYAVSPVCMPSRASFITGRYPQGTGVLANGMAGLRKDLATLPSVLAAGGYRTANIGKLHLEPYMHYPGSKSMEDMHRWEQGELDDWNGPYYGFDHVEITIGHGNDGVAGHYGRWRHKHHPDAPTDANRDYPSVPDHNCFVSRLPVELHASTWVADRAIAFLDEAVGSAQPFYLNISFADPHHPFTPPLPWGPMFDDRALEAPHRVRGENETKPGPWKLGMTGEPFPKGGSARLYPELTERDLHLIRARSYAMIALIDHQVGRVIATLQQRGLADNTIIVYTSDHGDFLGDHWFLYKGEIPARPLLHIPLIVSDPAGSHGSVDEVCSNVDVMPTLLSRCGVNIPASVQGVPLPTIGVPAARDYAYETVVSPANPDWHHHSLYTRDWKIAYWPYLADGELYDLRKDPLEYQNLFDDPAHRQTRGELIEKLFAAAGAAEPRERDIPTLW